MASDFPVSARVVIVGGGIMGCGLAYHLAHEGWTDVVLLEKAELTSGSTWHAAGQITHSTSSVGLGTCVDYNVGLYAGKLEAETGQSVSWHGCGSFRLAYTEDEMDWLRQTLSVGRALRFNMELVTPARVRELHPFYNLDGVIGVIRDDKMVSGYIRMEQKSSLIGIYEKSHPNAVWTDECPWAAENELFSADYDRIMPWLANAMERMPVMAELGIKREVHGAISHPPDGNPLIGPAAGVRNYWCCCGTQIGIGWGPGLTRELARWMVHGAANISMREFDPRRFGPYAGKSWQVVKAKEDYCLRHEIPFPHFNRLAGRPVKPSPLHERLQQAGAVFEEVFGHERPRWFSQESLEQRDYYSFRRPAWHDMVAMECRAVRERVGIMDITAFAKVEITGPDTLAFIDRLVANKLPRKTGGIALTHLLNRRGRIELETTVVRLADDRFYLVCAAFFEQRLVDHLTHHRNGESITIINHSSDWAALALQGPKARLVLEKCTDAPLDNASFRWLSAQQLQIAGKPILALRLSYGGELGWELHGQAEHMLAVYEALWVAGEKHGIANYGSFAMNALRMEKGFKGAAELTNEVTLPEADVMRFVSLEKGDFLGSDATSASLDQPLPWVCAYLQIEPDGHWDGNGGEAVRMGTTVVGSTSSVAYGHTVGKILAFAYVKPQTAVPGTVLDVFLNEAWRQAVVLGEAAIDPQSLLPRTDVIARELSA